jgi:hypothetical protein
MKTQDIGQGCAENIYKKFIMPRDILMDEKTARQKWCPMVRYKSSKGEGINRWIDENDKQKKPDMSRCIASDCMMWRWKEIHLSTDEAGTKTDLAPQHGFCGLAGKL